MNLTSYWNHWNEREKAAVIIGTIVLAIYFFYYLIYSPLNNAIAFQASQVADKESTLLWMESIKRQQTSTGKRQTINNSQLLALIGTQLKKSSFQSFPYQLQQTSTGEVQLMFETVPFNPLLVWLQQVSNQYTITLKQLNAERLKTPGVVKCLIILSTE